MKVMVCGPIGYEGIDRLKSFQAELADEGFDVLDHLNESMDYSHVHDFREKPTVCDRIVTHDLAYVEQADAIVALLGTPSYGTAIELFRAHQLETPVFGYCPEPVASPWPVQFADAIFAHKADLFQTLHRVVQSD